MDAHGKNLVFTRRCARTDIIIGVIAATAVWVALIAIGLNVAETTEAQLIVTGALIAAYLAVAGQFVTLTSTAVHAIIIRPDHTLEFRYANPRFDRRIPVQEILMVYRPPRWESFSILTRFQRTYQPGLTYIIHQHGNLALGKLHHFRAYRDLLRALVAINPAIVVHGIAI